MDFSTGNSGNRLVEAVVKTGTECLQEGSYCEFLGPDVAPFVYGSISNGYVMEKLEPAPRTRNLLRNIEKLLETRVWNRPALPSTMDCDWRENLRKYGVETPDWAVPTEFCLVHGDPTASNALIRGNDLILCDPRPPRDYIPQCRETDMGRILQSYLGWEEIAYGAEHILWNRPDFYDNTQWRKKAIFWCGAAAARIEYLEHSRNNRVRILHWCQEIRRLCSV